VGAIYPSVIAEFNPIATGPVGKTDAIGMIELRPDAQSTRAFAAHAP